MGEEPPVGSPGCPTASSPCLLRILMLWEGTPTSNPKAPLKPEGPTAAAPPSASLLTTQTPPVGAVAHPASCEHAVVDVANFAAENGDGQATVCVVAFSGNPASPKQTMVQANLAAAGETNLGELLPASDGKPTLLVPPADDNPADAIRMMM
ncbi:hypothetical protein L7F22_028760 [Adiantum nelumboides]|nr:hypothetical protein [Adiantum nelumboides]